jgi:hypothetical protein
VRLLWKVFRKQIIPINEKCYIFLITSSFLILLLGKSIVDGLIDNVIFPLLETGKSPAETNYFEKYWNNETTKTGLEKIASEFKSQAFIEKIEKRNKRMGLLILGFGSEFY